jgi:hypothetical protein
VYEAPVVRPGKGTGTGTYAAGREELAATLLKKRGPGLDMEGRSKEARAAVDSELGGVVAEWISHITGVDVVGKDLQLALKNGEVLCALMNALVPDSIPKPHIGKTMHFKHRENIGMFLRAISKEGQSHHVTPCQFTSLHFTSQSMTSRHTRTLWGLLTCLCGAHLLPLAAGRA